MQWLILVLYMLLVYSQFYYIIEVMAYMRRWKRALAVLPAMIPACVLLVRLMYFLWNTDKTGNVFFATGFANELPLWSIFLIAALCGGWTIFLAFLEKRCRSSTVTRESIKESADDLPTGLCFSTENGAPLLYNRIMYDLCCELSVGEGHNVLAFWESLPHGAAKDPPDRTADYPEVRTSDGRIWTFARNDITVDHLPVIQLTAVDTTDLNALTEKLKNENRALASLNERLSRHAHSIDELTRREELLAAKMRIHDDMGRALLATRYYLSQETPGDCGEIVSMWKHNIAILRREASASPSAGAFKQLTDAAEAVGVAIVLSGTLPESDQRAMRLVLLSAKECLTNAVRHAGASKLFIDAETRLGRVIVSFSNDGTPPAMEIVEGGGLSSLRRRVEDAGGSMETVSLPQFRLKIDIPTERGDGND